MMNIGKTVIGAILAIGTLTMTSCNTIDDDLSDCGKDYRIDYVIRMVSNPDAAWQALLGNGNSNSFALSFHKAATGELVKSSTLQNQPAHTSLTVYLDADKYRHIGVANVAESGVVSLRSADNSSTAFLEQQAGEVIDSHKTPIYTGKLAMDVSDAPDKNFLMNLYQVNAVTEIFFDDAGTDIRDLKVYITDMADGFQIADSVYTYHTNPLIRTRQVDNPLGSEKLFMGVTFPSRGVWNVKVYATLPNGTVTETILTVNDPLKAGEIRQLRFKINQQGAVLAPASVGASVTFDWKHGQTFDPQF
ncbi:hypothetical protein [Prevotella sp.]|uniref:hypothetical protein n=1 Tax=Prevotella sp. TaxID=59823 RepID=UPI002F9391AF